MPQKNGLAAHKMNVNEELHPYTSYKLQSPFLMQLPIQSMELEYLPTFGVDFYGFHVGIIYPSHESYGKLHLFIGCPNSKSASTKVSTSGWPNGFSVLKRWVAW